MTRSKHTRAAAYSCPRAVHGPRTSCRRAAVACCCGRCISVACCGRHGSPPETGAQAAETGSGADKETEFTGAPFGSPVPQAGGRPELRARRAFADSNAHAPAARDQRPRPTELPQLRRGRAAFLERHREAGARPGDVQTPDGDTACSVCCGTWAAPPVPCPLCRSLPRLPPQNVSRSLRNFERRAKCGATA